MDYSYEIAQLQHKIEDLEKKFYRLKVLQDNAIRVGDKIIVVSPEDTPFGEPIIYKQIPCTVWKKQEDVKVSSDLW